MFSCFQVQLCHQYKQYNTLYKIIVLFYNKPIPNANQKNQKQTVELAYSFIYLLLCYFIILVYGLLDPTLTLV